MTRTFPLLPLMTAPLTAHALALARASLAADALRDIPRAFAAEVLS